MSWVIERIRAFIATNLSITATRKVAQYSAELRQYYAERGIPALWVSPPNLHLTLKFLGDVDPATLFALKDALRVLERRHPLEVDLSVLDAFPDPSTAEVLWLGISKGKEAVVGLMQEVEAIASGLGFASETRPFVPHITLGRLKRPVPLSSDLPKISGVNSKLQEVITYRSDTVRPGSEYEPLARIGLRAHTK